MKKKSSFEFQPFPKAMIVVISEIPNIDIHSAIDYVGNFKAREIDPQHCYCFGCICHAK